MCIVPFGLWEYLPRQSSSYLKITHNSCSGDWGGNVSFQVLSGWEWQCLQSIIFLLGLTFLLLVKNMTGIHISIKIITYVNFNGLQLRREQVVMNMGLYVAISYSPGWDYVESLGGWFLWWSYRSHVEVGVYVPWGQCPQAEAGRGLWGGERCSERGTSMSSERGVTG